MYEELFKKSFRVLMYDELEDYEEVISTLSEELRRNPTNGAAYNNRAVAFWEIGRIDEALADLGEALKWSPHDYVPHVNRAQIYEKQEAFPPQLKTSQEQLP